MPPRPSSPRISYPGKRTGGLTGSRGSEPSLMCVGDSGSGSGVGPADGAGVRRVGVVAGPDSGSCGRSPRVVSLIATPGALLWDGGRIPTNRRRGHGPGPDFAFT